MDLASLKQHFIQAHSEHSDAIFRYTLWKASDRETALDITQDTFMRYWDEVSKGTKIGNPRALLFTIARRLVIDHYRRKKTESIERREEAFEEDAFETPDESALGQIELNSEARIIRDRIALLDPAYRQAVYLRFVEGLTPRDIAKILSISPNLASVRIDRGIKELKRMIDPNRHER